jgi:hypothetical protein
LYKNKKEVSGRIPPAEIVRSIHCNTLEKATSKRKESGVGHQTEEIKKKNTLFYFFMSRTLDPANFVSMNL